MTDELKPSQNPTSGLVDVGGKSVTDRTAEARAEVRIGAEIFADLERSGWQVKKGSLREIAAIAGMMAAKRTPEWIPHCHPIPLHRCDLRIEGLGEDRIEIRCVCAAHARTGVEMEAMTGAAAAALTIYDLLKSRSHGIEIGPVALVTKTGGKSDFGSR